MTDREIHTGIRKVSSPFALCHPGWISGSASRQRPGESCHTFRTFTPTPVSTHLDNVCAMSHSLSHPLCLQGQFPGLGDPFAQVAGTAAQAIQGDAQLSMEVRGKLNTVDFSAGLFPGLTPAPTPGRKLLDVSGPRATGMVSHFFGPGQDIPQ